MKKQAELIGILTIIETTSFHDVQSIEKLLEYGYNLTAHLAFTSTVMSEAKHELHVARRAAYLKMEASLTAQNKKWSALLAKDYVNDCCANENAYYELAERCNRTITHSIDLCRTAISALKEELKANSFPTNA